MFDQKWPRVDQKDPVHHDHNQTVPAEREGTMRLYSQSSAQLYMYGYNSSATDRRVNPRA